MHRISASEFHTGNPHLDCPIKELERAIRAADGEMPTALQRVDDPLPHNLDFDCSTLEQAAGILGGDCLDQFRMVQEHLVRNAQIRGYLRKSGAVGIGKMLSQIVREGTHPTRTTLMRVLHTCNPAHQMAYLGDQAFQELEIEHGVLSQIIKNLVCSGDPDWLHQTLALLDDARWASITLDHSIPVWLVNNAHMNTYEACMILSHPRFAHVRLRTPMVGKIVREIPCSSEGAMQLLVTLPCSDAQCDAIMFTQIAHMDPDDRDASWMLDHDRLKDVKLDEKALNPLIQHMPSFAQAIALLEQPQILASEITYGPITLNAFFRMVEDADDVVAILDRQELAHVPIDRKMLLKSCPVMDCVTSVDRIFGHSRCAGLSLDHGLALLIIGRGMASEEEAVEFLNSSWCADLVFNSDIVGRLFTKCKDVQTALALYTSDEKLNAIPSTESMRNSLLEVALTVSDIIAIQSDPRFSSFMFNELALTYFIRGLPSMEHALTQIPLIKKRYFQSLVLNVIHLNATLGLPGSVDDIDNVLAHEVFLGIDCDAISIMNALKKTAHHTDMDHILHHPRFENASADQDLIEFTARLMRAHCYDSVINPRAQF